MKFVTTQMFLVFIGQCGANVIVKRRVIKMFGKRFYQGVGNAEDLKRSVIIMDWTYQVNVKYRPHPGNGE